MGLGRGWSVLVSLGGRRGGMGLSSIGLVIVDGGRSCGVVEGWFVLVWFGAWMECAGLALVAGD